MRKLLISILLAGAAASPALAQDRGDRDAQDQVRQERSQAHEERKQSRQEARSERSNGGANSDRAQQAQPQRPAPQLEMRQQVQGDPRGGFDRSRFERGERAPQHVESPQQAFGLLDRGGRSGFAGAQPEPVEQARQNGGWGRDRGNWERRSGGPRQAGRPIPNVMRAPDPLIVSDPPRQGQIGRT